MSKPADTMEKIVALCRRRGFIFGSSEIYGGIGGFWDYGPLGTELKRNIKDAWWLDMVRNPPVGPNGVEYQMVGVDCSIIMNPEVWKASGHVGGFNDPMVACKGEGCKRLFRADQLWVAMNTIHHGVPDSFAKWELENRCVEANSQNEAEQQLGTQANAHIRQLAGDYNITRTSMTVLDLFRMNSQYNQTASQSSPLMPVTHPGTPSLDEAFFGSHPHWLADLLCPACKKKGQLTEPREFNLMFESHTGAVRDDATKVYLRPETAQGIFVNFKNVMDSTRVRLPFGIAQIGKAFRNEINPRNYTFRSREFEQMEIEFFCHPSEADMWYEYWRDLRYKWYVDLGLKSDKLRLRDHEADELAHYARGCADVEYAFPFGVSELEGIANRTDFDLSAHQKHSGKDLTYFDDVRKERYTPYVIEPSAGVDRFALAVICEAYSYDESRASPECMKFHPRLAPIKAAVFPLVAKDGMPEIAEPIYRDIKKFFPCQYDAKQSIGRRYARMDEAGTPFCFTIDGQSKEDGTVTVRNRDDASQIRIDKSRCVEYLHEQLHL